MRTNGGSSFWTDARIPLVLIVGLYSHNGEWVVNEHRLEDRMGPSMLF
jgi:hypothetical protein